MQITDVELDKNYFELFDLEPSFSLSLDQLAQTFKLLQLQVHPDRFANATEAEKRLSVQFSSLINQAYQTLRNPLERAKYLLTLHGASNAINKQQSHTIKDTTFLMQQMELREALQDIQSNPDPVAALMQMDDEIAGQIQNLHAELERYFRRGQITEPDLAQAADCVNRLQFLNKLQAEIGEKQHQLL